MRTRLRRVLADPLALLAAAVATVPWLVQPGVLQPDTKVDLVVSPWRYLHRALSAWSTHSGFGELQNQAYGYLFPMGPFFGVAHSLGVPGWATQRAWWSLLLGVGALGAALVGRRILGFGTGAAVVAGGAYALSPRVLTLLSELSVETWPGMLMPWLLLAVHARARALVGDARFVGVVGLLTASLGGVNATASLVAVLGGLLCALSTRRARLVIGFLCGSALGAAWWLGPLLVLGGYSYPFLDFIETSRITTAVTSVPGILRGASDWVAYIVDADGHPTWQSGWVVAQGTMSLLGGCVLAGLGAAGLLQRWFDRGRNAGSCADARGAAGRFFGVLLLLGVLGMGIGRVGAVDGPLAEPVRHLLDGPLAAARNVHKLDPFVRLPLALGLGVLIQRATTRCRAAAAPRARWVAVGVVAALGASMAPFWQGRLGDAAGVPSWPAALAATADAVDARAQVQGGSTLVLPSARAATYEWGTSSDEPLTAFAASPIAVRASAPLVHPGAQRLMDEVDERVAAGRDMDAVAAALRRAGVRRVVVRSGLTSAQQTAPASAYVAALARSDGFREHRTFGAGAARYDLFDVAETPRPVSDSRPVAVLGGPESTLSLATAGVTASASLMVGARGGWITDDVRKRAYNNGRPAGLAFGPTLTATSGADERVGARDLDFSGRAASTVVLDLEGLTRLNATSSTADPFTPLYLGPGTGPGAALDDSRATAWLAPADEEASLSLEWPRPRARPARVVVHTVGVGGATVGGLRALVHGRALPVTDGSPGAYTFTLPAGSRQLTLVTRAGQVRGGQAAVGISAITAAQQPWRAVLRLPGRFDPTIGALQLTRTHPVSEGRRLRGEDDGTWTRRVDVTRSAPVDIKLRVTPGGQQHPTHVRHLRVRPVGGPWRAIGLSAQGRLTLPAGMLDLEFPDAVESVTVTPASAAARAALGLPRADGSAGRAASSAKPPVLASTQGANSGWRSVADGWSPVVIDGWRQGFVASGEDAPPYRGMAFQPQRAHVTALAVGAFAVLCAVMLVLVGRRRDGDPALLAAVGRRRPALRSAPRRAAAVGALVRAIPALALAVLLGGWWGLAAALLALAVPARRRPAAVLVLLAAAGPVLASLGIVDRASAGAFGGQLLGVAAVSLVALGLCGAPSGWPASRRRSS